MKAKFTLVILFVAAFLGMRAQQIPNGSFDTWSSALNPDGWATYSSAYGINIGLAFKDSTDKIDGPASVKLVSDSIPGFPAYGVQPGVVSAGSGSAPQGAPVFKGIPFAFRPDTLQFGFKYLPAGNQDSGLVNIFMKQSGSYILAGGLTLGNTSNIWYIYSLAIDSAYMGSGNADTLSLYFFSSADTTHKAKNSTLKVDRVRFGYAAAPSLVEEIDNDMAVTVYPNPCNTDANLSFSKPLVDASVMVFDINGRVVTHELVSGTAYQFNTTTWPTALYSYAVINSSGKVINKGRINVTH